MCAPVCPNRLETQAQIIQFLNTMHIANDSYSSEVYTNQDVNIKQVLSTIWQYSNLYEYKSVSSFGKWCSEYHLESLNVPANRKKSNTGNHQAVRSLFRNWCTFVSSIYVFHAQSSIHY
jgi:hypothetical protein